LKIQRLLAHGVVVAALGCTSASADEQRPAPERAEAALAGPQPEAAPVPLVGDTAAVRSAAAAVRAGMTHSAAGDAAAAARSYARAAELVPALRPWAHALAAAAAARTGDTAAVRRHLAASDPEIVRDWGWRARVDGAHAAGDRAGAARLAELAAAAMTEPARRTQALTRAGVIHAEARHHARALAALRGAIDESVAPAAAVEAARVLGTLPDVTAEDWRRIGRVYLRHRNMERATSAYDAYMAAATPPAAERATIQLELGRALFDTRNHAAAERRLRGAVTGGTAEVTAQAALLLGRALHRQGRTADARAALLRVTMQHRGTGAAARAHFIIADIDHYAGRTGSAKTHYRAVVQARGPDAAVSLARLGAFYLMERRYREAATIFADGWHRLDGSAQQLAGYWWAHSLEAASARDSARTVFDEVRHLDPLSYYGLRAGERTGARFPDLPPGQAAPVDAVVRREITGRVDALAVLQAAELADAVELEAARITGHFSDMDGALYTLGAAFHAREQTFHGIRIGRELLRRDAGRWNRAVLELIYPFPYRDYITRYARENGLDPYLVAGLIRQESMFNPRARSGPGALGLMQVMPNTGTAVARTLGIDGFQPARLIEPSLNIRIGTRYLAQLIRNHNGRLNDAIAAYNAGSQRVARWRQFPEYMHDELFIERIPFEETRNYVKIVLQNARIYRELYGP
jgi:soluble lytic murein transglycosylase